MDGGLEQGLDRRRIVYVEEVTLVSLCELTSIGFLWIIQISVTDNSIT